MTMLENADSPNRGPHAVVPVGQMRGDGGLKVMPPGQAREDEIIQAPDVPKLRRMFDEARDLTDKARAEQQQDLDYYDGYQANSEVRRVLELRKQPLIIDNRVAPAIDGILGVIENGKSDPRAYPRNPQDQAASDVATKTLRYIADRASWQNRKMECAEDYLKQGITAAIVEFDGEDITVSQIRWETFFYDPRSRKADFSDAKYLGIAKWMYADDVKAHPDYAERARQLGDLVEADRSILDESWEDRPDRYASWTDHKARRVMVVEIYYNHMGEWLRCVFCAAGWLDYGPSPYIDVRSGRTRCPIFAQSFKVDRKNERYGPIRNMRSMQDEVNARRSRGLHLLNSRQVQMADMSADPVDSKVAREEAARADGVMPRGWQIVPTSDMAAGNLNMLAEAKESLQRMVPVALAQDLREGSASSGRARQVAQQAGLTQFGRGFGQFADFETIAYRHMWMAAQQFWTGPMYVRVTDNPRAPEFLQINEPVMGLVVSEQVDPMTGQMVQGLSEGQTGTRNQIAAMDMDIIIGTTPDTVALESEVFETLADLVRGGVDPISPVFEIMIEFAPLPDKTNVIERIQAIKQQLQQQQQEAAAAQAEAEAKARAIGEAQAMADINKSRAEAAKTVAQTEDIQATTMAKAIDATTRVVDGDREERVL